MQNDLLREYSEAKDEVRARALMADIESWPATLDASGMGRILFAIEQPRLDGWPEHLASPIREIAKAKAIAVLRPILSQAAAYASTMGPNLDDVAKVRAKLVPLENYRPSLERVFGTIDPEGLLNELWRRVAEIEADPAFIEQLRSALATARSSENPGRAEAALMLRVVGPNHEESRLAKLLAKEPDSSPFAETRVEDMAGPSSDPYEPTAEGLAKAVYDDAKRINKRIAEIEARCKSSTSTDAVTALTCAPWAATGLLIGGLTVRVARVVKLGCTVEMPDWQYRCRYKHELELTSTAAGRTAPDILDAILGSIPGGYQGEEREVSFVRDESPTSPGQITWSLIN